VRGELQSSVNKLVSLRARSPRLRREASNEATEDEMSEEVPSPPGEANLKIQFFKKLAFPCSSVGRARGCKVLAASGGNSRVKKRVNSGKAREASRVNPEPSPPRRKGAETRHTLPKFFCHCERVKRTKQSQRTWQRYSPTLRVIGVRV